MQKELVTFKSAKSNKDFGALESYKALRTNLLYSDDAQVITITSTMSGEGKTVSAFNLAQSFAAIDKRVLLIDCDLRKGSLRRHCAISGKVIGLSEALTGQSGEIIYPTANPYLDVVFSGKRPPNPSELLSGDMFGTILDELKKAYDYIIIDTPPMTACIDAAIVGRMSDGVVLVVRNEMVRKKDLRKVKSQLQRNGARVLGVVLNGVKKNQVDYSGYGHYGHYGEEEVA